MKASARRPQSVPPPTSALDLGFACGLAAWGKCGGLLRRRGLRVLLDEALARLLCFSRHIASYWVAMASDKTSIMCEYHAGGLLCDVSVVFSSLHTRRHQAPKECPPSPRGDLALAIGHSRLPNVEEGCHILVPSPCQSPSSWTSQRWSYMGKVDKKRYISKRICRPANNIP